MLLVVVGCCWLLLVVVGWLLVVVGWLVVLVVKLSVPPNMKKYAWTCSDHFGRRCFARIFFIVVLVCFVFQVFHVI